MKSENAILKYILLISFFLNSCETIFESKGYVLDIESKEPIQGVELSYLINNKQEDYYVLSDTSGYFHLSSYVYPCVWGCPDAKIKVVKEGYNTIELDYKSEINILMENLK